MARGWMVSPLVLSVILTGTFGVACARATSYASDQPVALVFRGPATSCCAREMADILRKNTKQNFRVVFVGGKGDPDVETGLAMPGVKLYAQPGGDGEDYNRAFRRGFKNDPRVTAAIQQFVRSGGRYLGICMGAYFTASDAFDIFPGQMEDYPTTRGASVTTTEDVVIPVTWRGKVRQLYYQGGPSIVSDSGAGVTVLGTYSNGEIAAATAAYGKGKIGITGVHPEAPKDWYAAHDLPYAGSTQDLADDLIDTLMQ